MVKIVIPLANYFKNELDNTRQCSQAGKNVKEAWVTEWVKKGERGWEWLTDPTEKSANFLINM